jgi:hypothetical protein
MHDMHNMHTRPSRALRAALLACALFAGAGHASASASYHVTIDTQALPAAGGYLDFLFAGLASSADRSAVVSNATGAFDYGNAFSFGTPQGSLATSVKLGNFDEFATWAQFGGQLSFDVRFDGLGNPGTPGIDLSVALLDSDGFSYAPGTSANVVTFSLLPGAMDDVTVDASLAAAVPEPATPATMAAGGLLLAGVLRRRR